MFARLREILAVIQTESGWTILFEGGEVLKKVTLEQVKELIGKLNQMKYLCITLCEQKRVKLEAGKTNEEALVEWEETICQRFWAELQIKEVTVLRPN